jgi:hypothetical protein
VLTVLRKEKKKTIDLVPVRRELVSPGEFLRFTEEERRKISRTIITPAKLGSKHFGGLWVEYHDPIFKMK